MAYNVELSEFAFNEAVRRIIAMSSMCTTPLCRTCIPKRKEAENIVRDILFAVIATPIAEHGKLYP